MATLMEARPTMAEPVSAAEITAANVRMACARVGWRQTDLARAIGMSQQAVNVRWTGKRQWQLEDLDRVATVLGTTPWALVKPSEGDTWAPELVAGMENASRPAGATADGEALVRQKGLEPPTF